MRALGAFVLAIGAAAAFAGEPQPPPSPEARAAWGFDRSDLPPDPAIRFGVAASGLRYAILPNRSPRGAVSIRVRVAAGAAAGAPGEAHFLEHLAFQGSAHFADGASARLRREGLAIGRDFNAHTGYRDTIYRIDLRRAGAARLGSVLALIADMIFAPDLSRRAITRALPGLIEEARQRDGAEDRAERDLAEFLTPGSPFARGTGGSEAELRAVTAEGLAAFRARYYSPDRVTLIIVGDVDPESMENWIAALFDSRMSYDGPPAPPPPPVATDRPTAFRLFHMPDTPTWVTVAALTPSAAGADGAASRDEAHLASLGADMLAARITGYRGSDRPFMDADAIVQDYYGLARIARFRVRAIDRDWRAALALAESELRRALRHGFTQEELDAALRIEGERLAGLAAPSGSAALADRLVALVSGDIVPTAPAGPADSAAWLSQVRLDAVNAAFRAAWAAPGRLVHVAHDRAIEGGEARLAEIWTASAGRPVSAQ